jgi:hypothetical protein
MSEERRVKRWAPKVFSGCQTCKYDSFNPPRVLPVIDFASGGGGSSATRPNRHVKGEQHRRLVVYADRTYRCARSGLQCEGYAPPIARVFEPNKKKGRAQSQERTLAPRPSASATPTISSFQTREETRSFQFFMCKTAGLISIYSLREFWTVTIPQAAHQYIAVKHSVLALAVLHEALSRTDGLNTEDNTRLFRHYNNAIRAVTQSDPTTDVVLITCILFWIIENFNGAGQPSFDHMKAAQKILREFKTSGRHTDSPYYDVISRYIEPIITDAAYHAQTDIVQDIIDEVEEPTDTGFDTDQILARRMPTSYLTLVAVQDHLKSCLQAVVYFLNQDCIRDDAESLINRIETHLQRWVYLFHGWTASGSACQRRMLVLHHATATVLLAECKQSLDVDEEHYYENKSRYNWIVTELGDLLKEKPKPLPVQPSHELGVIPPLFTAAVRCKDKEVRDRALSVLKSMNRDEGSWTDAVAARIADGIALVQSEFKIGPKLNNILIERSEWDLNISSKDPSFDRLLGGSEEELTGLDMVSLQPLCECSSPGD